MTIRDRVRTWLFGTLLGNTEQLAALTVAVDDLRLTCDLALTDTTALRYDVQEIKDALKQEKPAATRDARMPAFIDYELSQHKALTEFKET